MAPDGRTLSADMFSLGHLENPAFVPADCCCQAYVLDVLKGKGKGWFPGPPRPGPPPCRAPAATSVCPVGPAPPVRHRYRAIGDKGSYKGTDGCSKGSCKGTTMSRMSQRVKGRVAKMRPPEPAVPPGRPKAKPCLAGPPVNGCNVGCGCQEVAPHMHPAPRQT